MKKIIKQSITALGLTLALAGTSGLAWADSTANVQARLDAEYQNGKVGAGTYADLTSILNLAQSSATTGDQATAVESYNVLLDAMVGVSVDAEAASRLHFN
jgi:hypothetical protein